jgi:hypothetical protein
VFLFSALIPAALGPRNWRNHLFCIKAIYCEMVHSSGTSLVPDAPPGRGLTGPPLETPSPCMPEIWHAIC